MYKYNVHTLSVEDLTSLIASGDDSKRNQIRIKENGDIFISRVIGSKDLEGIAGRFETFEPYNHHVGPIAAANANYIKRLFLTIQDWIEHPRPYIDVWVQL